MLDRIGKLIVTSAISIGEAYYNSNLNFSEILKAFCK